MPVKDAIVLDFDGVLAASMGLHAEAYRMVLAPWGVTCTDQEVYEREGARSETIIQDLLGAAGHEPSDAQVAELATRKQEAFASLGPIHLYPGAPELVRKLRAGARKLGLVTGTRRENLERLIPDLLPSFDAVLAQEDYTHDKPHPEPYARAAERLGVPPEACAALENAVRGVQSARAAGYAFVVGITTTMSAEALGAAGANSVAAGHEAAGELLLGHSVS